MSGGGGYGSKQHKTVGYKTGRGSKGINPGGVGQLGEAQGSHTTGDGGGSNTNYRGSPWPAGKSFQPTPFGNEAAVNTVCGPGGSRNVYGKSGTQGMQGKADPGNPPARGELFPGWGANRGNRQP
jgi:hypothetical protein